MYKSSGNPFDNDPLSVDSNDNRLGPDFLGDSFGFGNIMTSSPCSEFANPIDSGVRVYAVEHGASYKLCNYNGVLKSVGHELSVSCLLEQVMHMEEFTSKTLWDNVLVVPPGARIKFNQVQNKSKPSVDFVYTEAPVVRRTLDPAEIIVNAIKNKVAALNGGTLAVRLSGGVDSTSMLLAAVEVLKASDILAVTWVNTAGSAHADNFAASELCKKFGIQQVLLEFKPDLLFENIDLRNTPSLNIGVACQGFYEYETDEIRRLRPNCNLILDGHGGDQVFFDPVPACIVFDVLKEEGITSALRTLIKLSRLTGSNMYEVLARERRGKKSRKLLSDYIFTDRARELISPQYGVTSAANWHLDSIKQVVYQNSVSTSNFSRIEVFHPFTVKEMIDFSLSMDLNNSFSDTHTRLYLKESIRRRYGEVHLRQDKGHITGAYQKCIQLKLRYLVNLVKAGNLARDGYIEVDNVCKLLKRSSLGMYGVSDFLIKIVAAELMMDYQR